MTFTSDKVKAQEMREQRIDSVLKIEPEDIVTMQIPEGFSLNGWVYVLSNEAMPGIFKIGMTTSSPEVRAREVSQGTGVPMPYVVEHAFHSYQPRQDEAEIHDLLGEYRLNPNREFFKCEMDIILDAIAGQRLVHRDTSVESLADNCNVITFQKKGRLNLSDLFEDIGVSTFGDQFAIAEGLIRMACRMVKRQTDEGYSVLLSEGKAQRVKQGITQQYEHYLSLNAEQNNSKDIDHSQL
ncbi:GIY-YIG nuclease family protein [Lelliottia amnigena]|uniref:GIY-YIG nuclease family protein n=1 Tax=Lelliottia amnigena TaxID=61646 RepID=UPI0020911664|nr:GIY-YIG nuclease family protein [Lelliottia amnigena]USR61600.1 GIY-YIG nuclease family protein [Lelliottia amnigena]